MKNLVYVFVVIVALSLVAGCQASSLPATPTLALPTDVCTPTYTPIPTKTSTPTNTPTVIPTNTPTPPPTATPVPQILGRVYPVDANGQAVWVNQLTGCCTGPDEYFERVSKLFPDGSTTIHFDVDPPTDYDNPEYVNGPIVAPLDGFVTVVYSIDDGSQVIQIQTNPKLAGPDIARLAEMAGYTEDDVVETKYHLGHVNPLVEEGDSVTKGQTVATLYDLWQVQIKPKLAHVLILRMADGCEFQFSPCLVQNDVPYCGICDPESPYSPDNCP